MKLTVKRDSLNTAITAVNRLAVKPSFVVLIAKEGMLSVIANTETFVRFSVPAEIEEEGVVGLQYSVFADFLKLRKSTITLTHRKKENTLNVESGSRIGVFILEVDEEQYLKPDSEWQAKMVLDAKSVGILKHIVNDVAFCYFLESDNDQARLINNKDGFCLQLADNAHCAFYRYNEPLSKSDFEFQCFIKPLQCVLSFLDEKVRVKISKSMLMFESDQLTTTISASQDNQIDHIMQSEQFMPDEMYGKGEIVFNANKFNEVLTSMSVVSDNAEPIQLDVRGTKVKLKVKTNYGVSEDKMTLDSNEYGDFKKSMSFLLMQNGLECCSAIDETVKMRVSDNEHYYRLTAESKLGIVQCLLPFAEV